MSQTQPELINAITDLFGDSDSDDDDLPIKSSSALTTPSSARDNLYDSDNEIKEPATKKKFQQKAPTSLNISKHLDEDDLFQSDEEEEDLQAKKKKRSRLQKSDSSSSQSNKKAKVNKKERKLLKDQKKSGGRGADDAGAAGGESSDEYDSETDVKKTKEDDEFIDADEDDAELLREYDNENQEFRDDRPQFPNGRGGSNGLMPNESKNTPKVEDDPLSQALADMKKKKSKELTEAQKGEIAHDLLHKMDKSFHDDRLLYEQQLPAIHKLKLLPSVKKILLMKQLQMTLLDYDLLSVLKSWIEPIDKTALVGLTIRTGIYEVLSILPCQTEHIRRSGIGKTLVSLLKHKMETTENKQKIREIIEKWSRPIFGKSVDARAIDRRHKERLQTVDETQYIRQQALKQTSPRGSLTREEDITSLLSSKIETANDASDRVRLPVSNGFLFSAPVASQLSMSSAGVKAKKETEKGKRQELSKSLKQLRSDSGKKTFRILEAAVSGRDKA
jgi:transcription factor SPN1